MQHKKSYMFVFSPPSRSLALEFFVPFLYYGQEICHGRIASDAFLFSFFRLYFTFVAGNFIFKQGYYIQQTHYLYFNRTFYHVIPRMQVTNAKLVGAMWLYTHNGVTISNHGGNIGACDQAYGNSPRPYIDITLSGGQGVYMLIAVVNGVMREMATCGPNGSSITLTTWASQNGWVVRGNRITLSGGAPTLVAVAVFT
jgi:hypothetical protein